MVEIGWIDVNTMVSLLYLFSEMQKQGHLEAVQHFVGYLELRHHSKLAFNPSYLNIDHCIFWECDWTDFYEGEVEAIPSNAH